MAFHLLHPGDLPLSFWLVALVVVFAVAVGFAVALSLLLKRLLARRPPARRAPEMET